MPYIKYKLRLCPVSVTEKKKKCFRGNLAKKHIPVKSSRRRCTSVGNNPSRISKSGRIYDVDFAASFTAVRCILMQLNDVAAACRGVAGNFLPSSLIVYAQRRGTKLSCGKALLSTFNRTEFSTQSSICGSVWNKHENNSSVS